MIEACISKQELLKALECLEEAEKPRFSASLAVLGLSKTGKTISHDQMVFLDCLIARADERKPSQDWGLLSKEELTWYHVENGKVIGGWSSKDA